jgi:long-chain fatty acid transport protein
MRGATLALLLVSVLAPLAPAAADPSNFRPYLVGSRAAGMGGAFTALADDGSGPWYNPGGIAFARRSSLSLSASIYGLSIGSETDALGNGHDFNAQDLQTFPVATSAVFKWGRRATPDGAPANALVASAFVPDALVLDDRDRLGLPQSSFFLSQKSQTIWSGLTYARRIGRLGIGASAFVLIENDVEQLDVSAIAPSGAAFQTITARFDESVVGLVGAFGLRWEVTDQLHLGLSVFTPELGLMSQRRTYIRVTAASDQPGAMNTAVVVNEDGLTASPSLPLRVQAGTAFSSGRFTLAADAILLGPVDVTDDATLASRGLSRRVIRDAVVDGSIGLEYVADDRFPLRIGFFTDFAQAHEPQPSPPGGPDPNPNNVTHIDRYGGTLSIGYKTEHTATDLGVMISGGRGRDLIPNNLNFQDLKPTDTTQLLTYVFLASSYEF